MKRQLLYTVLPTDSGEKIEQILRKKMHLSGTAVRRAKFMEHGIEVNGKRVFTNYIVSTGESISFCVESEDGVSEGIVPVCGAVCVVYEDDDILVVNKGRNTPVHPSLGHYDDTLANFVMYYYKEMGKNFIFRAVNRLDSNTSGLMIVAKNSHAHKMLCEQIADRHMKRTYWGVVCGTPEPLEGTICAPIKRQDEMKLKRIVAPDGQRAVTHYKTQLSGQYSIVELILDTGRTHQIRVHMAYLGCPIVGDFLYGTEDLSLIDGHALHAKTLDFAHPMTGLPMHFDSELPDDMQDIIKHITP